MKREANLGRIVSSRPVQGTEWTFKKKKRQEKIVDFLTLVEDHEGQPVGF